MIPKTKNHKHQWVKKQISIGRGKKIIGYACSYQFKDKERGTVFCPARDYIDLV